MTNTESPSNALAIASSAENVAAIIRRTPDSYKKNQLSHDNCLRACRELLDDINAHGMNEDLDRRAANYIERTRRTVKAMTDLRSPVTKLFDTVRKEFTTLENDIDPARVGTVPFQLQQLRNQYAARRREEEEARRREEEARRAADQARSQFRDVCVDAFKAKFNELVNSKLNELTELNAAVTLDSYQAVLDTLTGYDPELPADWKPALSIIRPLNLSPDVISDIRDKAFDGLIPQFREQFRYELAEFRQELLDRLPSKLSELQKAAKASEEEAARIKARIAHREAQDAARKDAERKAREAEEARKTDLNKANAEAVNLFNLAQASQPGYEPKAKVTRKINVTAPAGYMQILSMWWAKEGSGLPKEELDKIFKKQISFCEKLANKQDITICDPAVEYVEEVKAR